VPPQPVDVIKRSSRWAGQHWLLDAVIGLVGPEWDQGRVAYYAAACGQDSQVDFTAVRPRIRKYDDLAREFSKAGRRRELLARDAVHRCHRASARESYFTAAVLYGAAQWAQSGRRHHRPDRAQASPGRPDHRVPQSGLAGTKRQASAYE
jgi:hypothetical protein